MKQVGRDAISAAEKKHYLRDGYLVRRRLFSERRMSEIRSGIDRRIAALPQEIRSENMLNWHLHDPWILDLAGCQEIIDLVEGLIGPDIAILTTRILSKPPSIGRPVPWHQDAYFWPLEPCEAVSFWLAVDEVTEENGAMRVLPGGHGGKLLEHVHIGKDENVLGEAIRPDLIDEDKAVVLCLGAGECSFHDIYLPHGSPPNRSDKRRCAFIVRYIPTCAKLIRGVDPQFGEDYPLYLVKGEPGANWYANVNHSPLPPIPDQRKRRGPRNSSS